MGPFNFQPAEFCKIFVTYWPSQNIFPGPKQISLKTRSQLIAAGIVLLPAVMAILQSETGLALVYLSFFIVMYREGLPSVILIIGFFAATLIVATLLLEKFTLAIVLTVLAALVIYFNRRQLKGNGHFSIVSFLFG